jgi:hypothetical protein
VERCSLRHARAIALGDPEVEALVAAGADVRGSGTAEVKAEQRQMLARAAPGAP